MLDLMTSITSPCHRSKASTYNGLAICLKSQGKYDEALETHKKALAIKLQILEPDDADIALTYHGMGVVVDYQDKFDEANTLYRKALAIRCVGDAFLNLHE